MNKYRETNDKWDESFVFEYDSKSLEENNGGDPAMAADESTFNFESNNKRPTKREDSKWGEEKLSQKDGRKWNQKDSKQAGDEDWDSELGLENATHISEKSPMTVSFRSIDESPRDIPHESLLEFLESTMPSAKKRTPRINPHELSQATRTKSSENSENTSAKYLNSNATDDPSDETDRCLKGLREWLDAVRILFDEKFASPIPLDLSSLSPKEGAKILEEVTLKLLQTESVEQFRELQDVVFVIAALEYIVAFLRSRWLLSDVLGSHEAWPSDKLMVIGFAELNSISDRVHAVVKKLDDLTLHNACKSGFLGGLTEKIDPSQASELAFTTFPTMCREDFISIMVRVSRLRVHLNEISLHVSFSKKTSPCFKSRRAGFLDPTLQELLERFEIVQSGWIDSESTDGKSHEGRSQAPSEETSPSQSPSSYRQSTTTPSISLVSSVIDLQALCVANAMLASSGLSPLTTRKPLRLFGGAVVKPPPVPIGTSSVSSAKLSTNSSTLRSDRDDEDDDDDDDDEDDDGDNESVGSEESDITSVHTRQNGSKDRSIDGSKTGGGSLVSRGSRGSGSKTSSQVLNANEAVADMAVGLVTLLVDLLAVISSPSTIRAKLCLAACRYLECLNKNELHWLFAGLRPEASAQMEKSLWDIFGRAFGTTEESQIVQLLMFEAAVDMFPSNSAPSTDTDGELQPAPNSATVGVRDVKDSSPLSASPLYSHPRADCNTPLSDFDHWLGVNQRSVRDAGSSNGSSSDSTTVVTSSSVASSVPSFFTDVDVYMLGCRILRGLADALLPMKEKFALGTLGLLATLLDKRGPSVRSKNTKLFLLHKEIAMLAAKCGKTDIAIKFCNMVLKGLNKSEVHELAWVTNLLSIQYCDSGQFDLAIDILRNALRTLDSSSIESVDNPLGRYERQIVSDPLRFRLARVLLEYGKPDLAAIELQILLRAISGKQGPGKTTREIAVLSWLLQAYLDLECADICKKIIVSIKNLRAEAGVTSGLVTDDFPSDGTLPPQPPTPPPRDKTRAVVPMPVPSSASSQSSGRLSTVHPISGLNATKQAAPATANTTAKAIGALTNNDDIFEPNLPKYCIASHNADLGEIISRVYFQSKLYVSALKSLTPTIIGSELLVGGKNGHREGILEMARLYYLRGKIQLEASTPQAKVKFPFAIGSAQLFTAVYVLFDAEKASKVVHRRRRYGSSNGSSSKSSVERSAGDSSGSKDKEKDEAGPSTASVQANSKVFSGHFTCKRAKKYSTPSDLLWDAMKWFRRAWDLFHAAGDEVRAAKAANCIAKCHLEPSFAPFALMNIPLAQACNLGRSDDSSCGDERERERSERDRDAGSVGGMTPGGQSYTSSAGQSRMASLGEVLNVMHFSLDISVDCCQPLLLLESYLNMAELRKLQEGSFEAVAFWWEARDLFMHLFGDGTLVPLVRRASMPFLRKIQLVLERLVRFLWACDHSMIKQNLLLLDLYLLFTFEIERAQRGAAKCARGVSEGLDDLLLSVQALTQFDSEPPLLLPSSVLMAHGAHGVQPKHAGPVPAPAPFPKTTSRKGTSISASSTLSHAFSSTEKATSSMTSATQARTNGNVLPKLISFSPPSVWVMADSTEGSNTSPSISFGDVPVELLDSNLRSLFPWLLEPQAIPAEGLTKVGPVVTDASTSEAGVITSVTASEGLRCEAALIENAWRCCLLLRRGEARYQMGEKSLASLRRNIRLTLRAMSLSMRRLRSFSRQLLARETTSFDEVMRRLRACAPAPAPKRSSRSISSGSGSGGNSSNGNRNPRGSEFVTDSLSADPKVAVTMAERVVHCVYIIQVGGLLLMYRPYNGAKHVQLFGGCDFATYASCSAACLLKQQQQQQAQQQWHNGGPTMVGLRMNSSSSSAMSGGTMGGVGMGSLGALGNLESDDASVDLDTIGPPPRGGRSTGTRMPRGPRSVASDCSSGSKGGVPEATLSHVESQMLFDLSVNSTEADVAGGVTGRKIRLDALRNGLLKGSIQFIREADFDAATMESSGEMTPGQHILDDETKCTPKLPSGLLNMWRSNKSVSLPPVLPTPITILCARGPHIIPWEVMVNEVPIVRALCLFTLVSHATDKGRGQAGPRWGQWPVYVGVGQDMRVLPSRLAADVKSREVSRRAVSAVRAVNSDLGHNVSHIAKGARAILNGPPALRVDGAGYSQDAVEKYNSVLESFQSRMWPAPSVLVPLGRASTQSNRSSRMRRILFYDLSDASASPIHMVNWVQKQTANPAVNIGFAASFSGRGRSHWSGGGDAAAADKETAFPLVLLSYSDLVELADASVALLACQGDGVFIFTPHFCGEIVAKEVMRSIDTWSKVDAPTARTQDGRTSQHWRPSGSSPTASGGSMNSYAKSRPSGGHGVPTQPHGPAPSATLPGGAAGSESDASSSQSQGQSSFQTSSLPPFREPSRLELTSRTWVYHAVMDAVNRLQEELAAPISVYI